MTPRSFSTAASMPVNPTSAAWAYFFADVRYFICFCWTCWCFCHLFLQLLACLGPSEEHINLSRNLVYPRACWQCAPSSQDGNHYRVLIPLLIPKGRISTTVCFMAYEIWDYGPGAALHLVCWCLLSNNFSLMGCLSLKSFALPILQLRHQ